MLTGVVRLCGSDAYVATNVSNSDVGIAPTKSRSAESAG